MTPEQAVSRILDDSYSTLMGGFYDVSDTQRREQFVQYITRWWHAINTEMESSG